MNAFIEYHPLDYENLAKNCAEELMRRDPCSLPLQTKFTGAGVYALFYTGDFAPYAPIRSPDAGQPIYVGKAVLKGGRKGVAPTAGARVGGTAGGIYSRVAKHVRSITSVNNLRIEDSLPILGGYARLDHNGGAAADREISANLECVTGRVWPERSRQRALAHRLVVGRHVSRPADCTRLEGADTAQSLR